MTTIEICNSYQMSITVTAIFSFNVGRYCAKGIFFLIVFFFFCEGSPLFESKIKSHSLRKSDTSQYGLEIEKIDFSETLPIFNLY